MDNKKIKNKILIVGLGNYTRGDDGAGIHFIRELKKEIQNNKFLIEVGTIPLNFLKEISQAEKVVAIDAIRGGEKPGTIYKLGLNDLSETTVVDSHGISFYDVIHMGRSMTGYPKEITVYGIEPQNIDFNIKISSPVKKAILKLKNIVIKDIFN